MNKSIPHDRVSRGAGMARAFLSILLSAALITPAPALASAMRYQPGKSKFSAAKLAAMRSLPAARRLEILKSYFEGKYGVPLNISPQARPLSAVPNGFSQLLEMMSLQGQASASLSPNAGQGAHPGDWEMSAASFDGYKLEPAGSSAQQFSSDEYAAKPLPAIGSYLSEHRELQAASPRAPAPAEYARWTADPAEFPIQFNTTDDISGASRKKFVNQDKALKALIESLEMPGDAHNTFVAGPRNVGKETAVRYALEEFGIAKKMPRPPEMMSIADTDGNRTPYVFEVPAGQSKRLQEAVGSWISEVKSTLLNFEKLAEKSAGGRATGSVEEIEEKINSEIGGLRSGDLGAYLIFNQENSLKFSIAITYKGRNLAAEAFQKALESGKITQEQVQELTQMVENWVAANQKLFLSRKKLAAGLDAKMDQFRTEAYNALARQSVADLRKSFPDIADGYVFDVLEERVRLFSKNFIKGGTQEGESVLFTPEELIHLRSVVSSENRPTKGAPVVYLQDVDYEKVFGVLKTDEAAESTSVEGGAYLQANGGFLVMNAMDVLQAPGVWDQLLQASKTGEVELTDMPPDKHGNIYGKGKPISIKVKAKTKVVLMGDHELYALMSSNPTFQEYYQGFAEFDTETPRTPETMRNFLLFVKRGVVEQGLLPFDAGGVAKLMEYAVSLTGSRRKLSNRFGLIANMMLESSYEAQKSQQKAVSSQHVQQAVRANEERHNLFERKFLERFKSGKSLFNSTGERVGQVNGLAVLSVGDSESAWGTPMRITAVTALPSSEGGKGVFASREANEAGPSFVKASIEVMSYLKNVFGRGNIPFLPEVRVALEQSDMVDGDSASLSQMYAILSSLSRIPVRQDFAVTGSMNQFGDAQVIGGLMTKITGFIKAATEQGYRGPKKFIFPAPNLDDLMLDEEVAQAVKEGLVELYPINSVEEGFRLLSGVEITSRGKDGKFAKGTAYQLIEAEIERVYRVVNGIPEARTTLVSAVRSLLKKLRIV